MEVSGQLHAPAADTIQSESNPSHTFTPCFSNIEGKFVPVLFFNWGSHHEGVLELYRHVFLTSALDWGEWSASRPGRFTSRERVPDTRWIWGLVGLRAVLDAVVRKNIIILSSHVSLDIPCGPFLLKFSDQNFK